MGAMFLALGLTAVAYAPGAASLHGLLPAPAAAQPGWVLASSVCTVAACLLLAPPTERRGGA
jgi:hypothetical protein